METRQKRNRRITSDEKILENNLWKMDLEFCKNIEIKRKPNSKGRINAIFKFNCPENHEIEIPAQNIRFGRKIKCMKCENKRIEYKKEKLMKERMKNPTKIGSNVKFVGLPAPTILEINKWVNMIFPYKYQLLNPQKIKGNIFVDGFCNECKNNFEKKNLNHILNREQIICSDICRNKRKKEKERNEKIQFYQNKIDKNPRRKNKIFVDDIDYVNEAVWVYTTCEKHYYIRKEDNFFRATYVDKHIPCKGCIEENKQKSNKRYTENQILEKSKIRIDNDQFVPIKAIFKKTNSGSSYWNVFFNCLKHPEIAPGKKIFGQINKNTIPCKFCSKRQLKNNANNFINNGRKIHIDYQYNEKAIVEAFNKNIYKIPVICKKHGVFETNYEQHIKCKKGFCPKCNTSEGQEIVKKILIENDLEFVENNRFIKLGEKYPNFYSADKDAKSQLKILKPDFYLPNNNFLIEYDGIYHYKIEKHRKKSTFYKMIKNDYYKNRYAIKNNINLLRISYLSDNNKDYELIQNIVLNSIFQETFYSKLYQKEILIKKSNMYLLVKRRLRFKRTFRKK